VTEQQVAESAVRGLAKELGVELPAEEFVQYAVFLVEKLKGNTWAAAIQAGAEAADRVKTEADAERARRERLGE
jgi:hypothetical protein